MMSNFLPDKTPQIDPLAAAELRAFRAEHKLCKAMELVKTLNRNNSRLIKQAYQQTAHREA